MDHRAGGQPPYRAARELLVWAAGDSNWNAIQRDLGWSTPLEQLPARRAYAMIYHRITDNLDEDAKLKVDALLGDARAQAQLDERRRESVTEFGFEVG